MSYTGLGISCFGAGCPPTGGDSSSGSAAAAPSGGAPIKIMPTSSEWATVQDAIRLAQEKAALEKALAEAQALGPAPGPVLDTLRRSATVAAPLPAPVLAPRVTLPRAPTLPRPMPSRESAPAGPPWLLIGGLVVVSAGAIWWFTRPKPKAPLAPIGKVT